MRILLITEDEKKSIQYEDILKSDFIVVKKWENNFLILKNRYGSSNIEINKLVLEHHLKYIIFNYL